jgi:hypothetical protein
MEDGQFIDLREGPPTDMEIEMMDRERETAAPDCEDEREPALDRAESPREQSRAALRDRNPFTDAKEGKAIREQRLAGEKRAKPMNAKSDLWDTDNGYKFTKYMGRLRQSLPAIVVCELCVDTKNLDIAEFSQGKDGSTSALKQHLKVHHKELYKRYMAAKDTEVAGNGGGGPNIRSSLKNPEFMELLCRHVVERCEGLNLVEDKGFRLMLQSLSHSVVLPGRKGIIEQLEKHKRGIEKYIAENIMVLATDGAAITADGWTSVGCETFYSLTISFITPDFEMVNLAFDCIKHEGQTCEADLVKLFTERIEKAKIPKVVALITDCESSMIAAGRVMSERGVEHIGCFAHRIEGITRSILKAEGLDKVLKTTRALSTYVHTSTQASAVLSKLSAGMGVPPKKIQTDCETRFWSTIQQLESVVYNEKPLRHLIAEPQVGCKIPKDAKLDEGDWEIIKRAVGMLTPCMLAQENLEGSKYVTGSLVIPFIHDVRKALNKVVQESFDYEKGQTGEDEVIESGARAMMDIFENKWGDGTEICTYQEGPKRQPKGFKNIQVYIYTLSHICMILINTNPIQVYIYMCLYTYMCTSKILPKLDSII